MTSAIDTPDADTHEHYRLSGSPTLGLAMGTWGFFVGFAAVALYGPAAKYFQEQMNLGGLALGLLVAAPQLTGSLLRIPFGAWVDRVGGRLPMLTLFALSLVGMWGLVFILLTVKTLTFAAYPIVIMFGFLSGCGVASFSVGAERSPRRKDRSCSRMSASGRRSSAPPRSRAPGVSSPCTSYPSADSWRSRPGFRSIGSICTTWM
jgi:MFS family permease